MLQNSFYKIYTRVFFYLTHVVRVCTHAVAKLCLPWILWKYILFDFIFSFFVTFVFFMVIFIFNQILLFAKNILEISILFFDVFQLLLYKLPEIISLSVPFATLVACLMSVGGFSSQNEFVAMRSLGISFYKTFVPYVVMACMVMIFSFFTIEVLRPWGAIQYIKQYQKILSLNPQLGLQNNSITKYQDDVIVVKSVRGTDIEGLVIVDTDSDDNKRTIVSQSAAIKNSVKGVISLDLYDVISISDEAKPKEYNYIQGKKLSYNVLLQDITQDVRSINLDSKSMRDIAKDIDEEKRVTAIPEERVHIDNLYSARSMVLGAYQHYAKNFIPRGDAPYDAKKPFVSEINNLVSHYNDLQAESLINRSIHSYKVVLYRKLSFPFATLLFVFFAFPVGLFYKRSGKSIGFGMGLIISFVYWFLIIILQSVLIANPELPTFGLMWLPNAAVFIFGIILFRVKRNI